MIRAVRNIHRLFRIMNVLAQHDALFPLERIGAMRDLVYAFTLLNRRRQAKQHPPGRRLAKALAELGPSFIKLGQALSTRPDLIGEEVAADLTDLQDRLPPFPFAQARQILEEDFERPLEELYSSFDPMPVAAASIAQVHFAVTVGGENVAVKILRPDIREAFRRDIDVFYWLAEIIERTQPSVRRLKPVEAVAAFAQTVEMEMDLRFEAAAAVEFANNFANDPTFCIPAVDWQRTSQRVLTVERVHGIAIDERERLIHVGIKPREVVTRAANAFFNMVFRDGFFHGDLHPGNMFVGPKGEVILIDFGITGRVDHQTRRYLGEMLLGFLTADYRRVAEIHFEAGYVPANRSVDAFTQACRSVAEPIFGRPMNEISIGRLLGHLFKVTETFGMETQPQLLLLQKTMITAEGVGRHLASDVNMWTLARPLIESWIRETLGPEARLRQMATDMASALEKIPRLVTYSEQAAAMFGHGGLKLHPDTIAELTCRRNLHATIVLPWTLVVLLLIVLLLIH
ncbi:Ubiquinone biosynthesis monooxygenase UbiB [invertebrate metagenome]|uniref:Ubiquinone biosynthesis monooxygenase UbiB n=1 Tax=invertebrate metagenome TaxID=1711999 RepID=A0A484H898_9ZZZZ